MLRFLVMLVVVGLHSSHDFLGLVGLRCFDYFVMFWGLVVLAYCFLFVYTDS